MLKHILLLAAVSFSAANASSAHRTPKPLIVKTHVNVAQSLDTVSSLVIGANAAIIIDLPLAIPQANALAAWVKKSTKKPLVAAFVTHPHADHYLSAAELLKHFPGVPLYANPNAVEHIKNSADMMSRNWTAQLGPEFITQRPIIPQPYKSSMFVLPGNPESPIHLISPLVGDTVDETMFWIPSIQTLIAGDMVWGSSVHIWISDLLTPALTKAWLSGLDFIEKLQANVIIPGHSIGRASFDATRDLRYTKKYIRFYQEKIQAKGLDYYTPPEIYRMIDSAFPGVSDNSISNTSALILRFSANEFGRGGNRFRHFTDLSAYNDYAKLTWGLQLPGKA
ncbi:hypothetical protein J1614_000443 [Plenodomus biglobosus]|nr:hypothetical protein J1614_000443 [Plenodomus biglobosus]